MGKIDLPMDDADAMNSGIAIKPVLLRKGKSKLALYGVGNVKDQRMHFELRSNRVRMFMPKDKDDWFNILLLHQNRYLDHLLLFLNFVKLIYIYGEYHMDLNSLCQRGCLMIALTLSFGVTSTTVVYPQNQSRANVIPFPNQDPQLPRP